MSKAKVNLFLENLSSRDLKNVENFLDERAIETEIEAKVEAIEDISGQGNNIFDDISISNVQVVKSEKGFPIIVGFGHNINTEALVLIEKARNNLRAFKDKKLAEVKE